MPEFVIDPPLLARSRALASLRLCEARLQEDRRWPWIVLIPRKPGAREIEHLAPDARALLMEEVVAAGAAVRAMGAALARPIEKLNVGALGNVAPQLHVHVVGRRADDAAWPNPIWGVGEPLPYPPDALEQVMAAALPAFQGLARR